VQQRRLSRAVEVVLAAVVLCATSAASNANALDAERRLEKARALHLSARAEWLRLGHWRGHAGDWQSEVDGPAFFLSPSGVADPQAELEATLSAMYAPVDASATPGSHALCRFPARAAWLSRELAEPPDALPRPQCDAFESYWRSLAPRSISLVFSSYYLNNPASAFGHTFLRFGREGHAGRPELLDNGVDYAANVDSGNALVYAFKGLTGQFAGQFHRMPFFYKVREYNDFESRDLWEYELALTQDQVRFVAAHLWELGSTHFDYWYLDENCGYHILGLLEVGLPDRPLIQETRFPVLPVDTVRLIAAQPGLVSSVRRRPSLRTTLRLRVNELSHAERDLAADLAGTPSSSIGPLARDRQARVLDAALDLVDIRYAKELIRETPKTEGHRLKQALLERRAALGVPSPALDTTPPQGARPDEGHGTARVGGGGGVSQAMGTFVEFEGRLALHDLADSPWGHPPDAQLEFLPTRLRFSERSSLPHIEDAFLVRIASLTPLSQFERALSWRVRTGVTTLRDAGCPACTVATVDWSGGVAFKLGQPLTAFAMADAGLQASGALTARHGLPVRLGVGPSGGLRLRMGAHITGLVTADWHWLPLGQVNETTDVSATLRWALTTHLALDARARIQPSAREASLSLLSYF